MDGWPNLPGAPPHYATHCVGPAFTNATAEYVSCFGSGTIRKDLIKHYQSPFAVETTHIKFKNSDPRAFTAACSTLPANTSFDVYGDKQAFEWPLIEGEDPVLHTAKKPEHKIPKRIKVKDYASRLPKGIRPFTTRGL